MRTYFSAKFAFSCLALAATHASIAMDAPSDAIVSLTFVHDIPAVPVTIGKAHTSLLLDTGGQIGITLSRSLIKRAGTVHILPHTSRHGDAAGHVFEVHDIEADGVALAGLALDRVSGEVNYRWGLLAGKSKHAPDDLEALHARGVIGLGALAPRPLLIDYPHGTMTVYPAGEAPKPASGHWLSVPMSYDKLGVSVSLHVGDKVLRMVLDTGSNATIVNPSALDAARFPELCAVREGNDCGDISLPAVSDDTGNALGDIPVRAVDLKGVPFDGLLGGDFLKQHAVLIDFARGRLWIAV